MRVDNPTFKHTSGGTTSPEVLISRVTSTSVAAVEYTLPLDFSHFILRIKNLAPATDAVNAIIRNSFDGGVTFRAGASDYAWASYIQTTGAAALETDAADTEVQLDRAAAFGVGNASGEGFQMTLYLFSHRMLSRRFTVVGTSTWAQSNGILVQSLVVGKANGATGLTSAVQFRMSSGNFSGTFELWGVREY